MLAPARATDHLSEGRAETALYGLDPPSMVTPDQRDRQDRALMRLGRDLLAQGYRFTTITPASHGMVQARPHERPPTLRDIFGWSLPFLPEHLPPHMLAALIEAGALVGLAGRSRSAVRFSTLGDQIFVHSAFPTEQADAVFFGPDTYRFARAVRSTSVRAAARAASMPHRCCGTPIRG
jgi:hypothetical protein